MIYICPPSFEAAVLLSSFCVMTRHFWDWEECVGELQVITSRETQYRRSLWTLYSVTVMGTSVP